MHWLQISTYKQHFFLWGRILSFVCVIHGTIGILLFWCYRSNLFCFKAAVCAHEQVPVIFDTTLFLPKKNSSVASAVAPKQKTSAKKVCKKQESNKKKEIKKQATQVENRVTEKNKKEGIQKNEPKKEVTEKELKKDQKQTLKVANSSQGESKKIMEKVVEKTEKENENFAVDVENMQQEEQRALLFLQLQKQIIAEWSAPVGMPKDIACTISFFVDLKGILQHISIDSSSGILMYDLSARAAIIKTIMPRWSRGKSFTITFHA